VIGFQEKPEHASPVPGSPDVTLGSMGIYIFRADVLVRALEEDAARADSQHDFGRNIIPSLIRNAPVFCYHFYDENKKAAKYWRDIGTLDAYFEANMDLCQVNPEFNLYDPEWPMRAGARFHHFRRVHRLGQQNCRKHPVPQRPRPQLLPD